MFYVTLKATIVLSIVLVVTKLQLNYKFCYNPYITPTPPKVIVISLNFLLSFIYLDRTGYDSYM